jgi:magnesium-transporting ATPase (P-type)
VLRSPSGAALTPVRVHEFDPALQRMASVVWAAGTDGHSAAFVAAKGAPETMTTLCDPASGASCLCVCVCVHTTHACLIARA